MFEIRFMWTNLPQNILTKSYNYLEIVSYSKKLMMPEILLCVALTLKMI